MKGRKAVLVNFWNCGCTPCREEFPHFQKLLDEFGGKGFAIIGVDAIDSGSTVARFLKDSGYRFHSFVGEEANQATSAYKVRAFPASYLLDSKGRIVSVFFVYDEKALRAKLASLGVQ